MRKAVLIVALLISLVSQTLSQTVVTLTPPMNLECVDITIGSEYTFKRSMACEGRFLAVADQSGSLQKESDLDSLDYTFDELGLFNVFCDVPSGIIDIGGINTPVACYNVQAINTVPTMGEWGLICLGVILMIFSVQAIMQKDQSFSPSE